MIPFDKIKEDLKLIDETSLKIEAGRKAFSATIRETKDRDQAVVASTNASGGRLTEL